MFLLNLVDWEPGQWITYEYPQEKGMIVAHKGKALRLFLGDGLTLYATPEASAKLGWKVISASKHKETRKSISNSYESVWLKATLFKPAIAILVDQGLYHYPQLYLLLWALRERSGSQTLATRLY